MRKVSGYLGKMKNGFGKGSIPKPILESVWDCIECVKSNALPLMGICLSLVGLTGMM